MIKCVKCAALSVALEQLKKTVAENEKKCVRTVVFCEDRLSLAAERTVCSAVEGTFRTSVYTFARFLAAECGKPVGVLSAQGSAMAVRKIIEENRAELTLFKQLSAPTAARSVYDTIALLYSSGISAEDVAAAAEMGGLLGGKLKDIALIYDKYAEYLKANNLHDRNGYLRRLAAVVEASETVRGGAVVFLGFQAFTRTAEDCVKAAFSAAADVTGLFIGGTEDIYVNEASAAFISAAREFGGAEILEESGELLPEADILRRSLFDPDSFYRGAVKTDKVYIFEADDGRTELEFIAACIKKHVLDEGERYSKISVMLPDLADNERELARVFSQYRIPYYADRRISLSEHPLCAFVFALLSCALSGCRPQDVDAVISSPFFPARAEDKDVFRNYALRLAYFRGGVKRRPKEEILNNFGWDISAVERVRAAFMKGYETLTAKGVDRGIFGGLYDVLRGFGVREKLSELSEEFKDDYPVQSAFGRRAFDGVMQVLCEAESLCDGMQLKDVMKILKSGFSAMEISLIPPKADAVFVGDIAATANTGSNVVFAARLTGDVPQSGADTALLTDREILALEQAKLNISPKIRQVNMRVRETVALNVCAFRKKLYLTYPTETGGDNGGVSEIVAYARSVFLSKSGAPLTPIDSGRLARTLRGLPYYASEKLPAIKQLLKSEGNPEARAAVYSVLKERGFKAEADAALEKPKKRGITCGSRLYLNYGSITPTALETYFLCPYLGYMRQGLRVQEREEGFRPVDSGNFIHSVLEDLAREINQIDDIKTLRERAEKIASDKLLVPPYSSLSDARSGMYAASELTAEAVRISEGMYEQLKNSLFKVSAAETKCEIALSANVKVFGRIDRVDEYGDLVRIIDYKTGSVDSSPAKYYMGAKLQLPLYLLAVSGGRRAAGAYYFPASVEYSDDIDGVFRLRGFMDGSDEVVSASDTTLQPKRKSDYFDAYLGGRKLDCAMGKEEFSDFLAYSGMVAKKGAEEMISGNISPSPAEDACKFCKMGGSCGFAVGTDGAARGNGSIKCADIARIASENGGKKNG